MIDREYERDRIVAAYARRASIPRARYSYFDPANQLLLQERELAFLSALQGLKIEEISATRILDVGSGEGFFVRQFVQWGALPENVTGIDLLPERVDTARRLCPVGMRIEVADASQLPFPDETFDLVVQATMLSSVLNPAMRARIASEMFRVLAPGGAVISYDFFVNNPRNSDVRRLTAAEIRELFPSIEIHFNRLTLAPPIGRAVARHSRSLYRLLSGLKFLSTHYLAVIRKPYAT